MGQKGLLSVLNKAFYAPRVRAGRRRQFRPVGERLEGRQLLASAVAVAGVQQHGIPSVFAIGSTGNISYNFLTSQNGQTQFSGWTPVPGGIGATSIATGTMLISGTVRPYVFMVDSAQNVYFNQINSSGAFNGWVPVGIDVGAVSISAGTIPITNSPYVMMINGNHDVYYNSRSSNGTWSGWSPVGVGVGAVSVATGVIQATHSATVYEPYVFIMNTGQNVYYKARNVNGTWGNWSPVGINVGAVSISATTIVNKPNVTMLNTGGNVYSNAQAKPGTWLGWLPVGAGSGSGATPAVGSQAIISSFNNYELATNTSGQLFSTFGVYGRWSTWFSLASLPAGVSTVSFTATAAPNLIPFAFAIGTDGNVYWADQTSWAAWSSFASLGAPA
jgi:hypothetical protein